MSGLIVVAFTVPLGVLATLLSISAKQFLVLPYLATAWVYMGYVCAYAYLKARSGNLVYNNASLGPIRFQSTLKAAELLKLYVTNALGILVSFGLLIPWAVIRTWRYKADRTRVWLGDDLRRFAGSDKRRVEAIGAEALDFFDVDISV